MTAIVSLLPELSALSDLLEEKPESFATGAEDVRSAALNATKIVFDLSIVSERESKPHILELLSSLNPAQAPQTRSQAHGNEKRKRGPRPSPQPRIAFNTTPLTSLFIDGMDDDQIWVQLDLRAKNVCEMLEAALEGALESEDEEDNDESQDEDEIDTNHRETLRSFQAGEEDVWNGLQEGMDVGSGDNLLDDGDEDDEGETSESGADEDLGEGLMELRDSEEESGGDGASSSPLNPLRSKALSGLKRPKKGRHKMLDDGFFDLASFNAETEWAEARSTSRGRLADDGSDEESVDFFALVRDTENPDEDDGNSGELLYRDFFEPPPRTKPSNSTSRAKLSPKKSGQVRFHEEVRVKNIKANGKNLPLYPMVDEDKDEDDAGDGDEDGDEDEDEDEDMAGSSDSGLDEDASERDELEEGGLGREIIKRLKDDLFDDEDEASGQDLSTHQKRLAALRDQIQALESENVGQKDWVLMGEAGSRSRPQNSLLEEDLEFERVMKAVPVITEEVVQILEERIKARILEGRYDDVVRIRPLEDKPFLPSRFFELKDTKSNQSLAQIYEDDYVAIQTGNIAGEDRDGKLGKEHEDIEHLWESICGKLDALCNAHFMPKQPKATITTISNASTTTLESALPTAKSVATILAPEEVFAPSSTDPRARSELTPAEKQASRVKERKAKKKSRDTLDKSVDKYAKLKGFGGVKKAKQAALESVVKSGKGVTVVGKKNKDIIGKKDRKRRT